MGVRCLFAPEYKLLSLFATRPTEERALLDLSAAGRRGIARQSPLRFDCLLIMIHTAGGIIILMNQVLTLVVKLQPAVGLGTRILTALW